MTAYYNEFDPFAAQWLRNLIDAGHIAPGDVDERDIWDITPDELDGYTQCHFFGGVGVWSYALRRAGWPDDRPVWTASCPCTPFSSAGARRGFADERDAWPAVLHLIQARRPRTLLGEQVAVATEWSERAVADLAANGYRVAGVDFSARLVGFPSRDRLYLAADAHSEGERPGPVDAEVAGIRTAASVLDEEPTDADVVGEDGNGPPQNMATLRAYGNALCAGQAEAFIRAYLETTNPAA